jgi:hypothetical protein
MPLATSFATLEATFVTAFASELKALVTFFTMEETNLNTLTIALPIAFIVEITNLNALITALATVITTEKAIESLLKAIESLLTEAVA